MRDPKAKSTHPYLKPRFWVKPSSAFWENENIPKGGLTYTESSKEYFRAFVETQYAVINRKWK